MRALHSPLVVPLLLGLALCATARADDAAAEYPPPCDSTSVSRGDVERAHTVFLSGKQYLEESNYDKAISYFKDAYSIDCSVHPILPIIATAYERKGDKAAAIRALREYLQRAPATPEREVIERRIRNLRDLLVREQASPPNVPPVMTVSPQPPASTPAITPAPADTGSPPVNDANTGAQTVDTVSPHTRSPAPWILAGAGVASVASGVVLLAIGASQVASAADACPARQRCTPDVASKGNGGRTMETVGGVLVGVGPVAVGAGLLWYFLSREAPTSGSPVGASMVIGPGYTGASLAGAF